MEPCAFCPNPATTKRGEHLFDDWVNLNDGKPRTYHRTEHGIGGEFISRQRARRVNVTMPVVCDPCNHGWMSALSNDASRILRDAVFRATPMRLNRTALHTITAYAVMKSIVHERGQADGPFAFSMRAAQRLAQTRRIPPGVQVWIASIRSDREHHARGAIGVAHFRKAHRGYRLHVYTHCLNYFVWQLTMPRWPKRIPPPQPLPFVRQIAVWDDVAVPIWPDVRIADWRNLTALTDSVFNDFVDRWSRAEIRIPRVDR
jgi:hypothetical protein